MRVVLFVLKCAVGLLASVGLLVVLLAVGAGLAWQHLRDAGPAQPEVPERAVLTVDLTNGLASGGQPSPLDRVTGTPPLPQRTALRAIRRAATDSQIKALAVRGGRAPLSMAQAQAVREAVARFRESGKPAVFFAETLGTGAGGTIQAYLSSGFGEVWLQPSGTYALGGFRVASPFFKEALDELGVEPRFAQRKAYKGFADRFTREKMAEKQKANLRQLVDGLMGQVARGVAGGRPISSARVRELSGQAPLNAERAVAEELVDELGYQHGVLRHAREQAGDGAELVGARAYAGARLDTETDEGEIAVIDASGPVQPGASDQGPLQRGAVLGADTVRGAVTAALEAEHIEAIVLRVNSPGGSYVASDTVWNAVKRAADADKPIVVSMGDIAASGGYFLAAPANHIAAQPGTLTGSIGVAGGKFVVDGLLAKLGVGVDGVQSGERADYMSPTSDFSEAEWARFQDSLDTIYADFTGKVARGRGLGPAATEKAAQGRIFTGKRAQALGLVDSLGGFHHAVRVAKRKAGMPERRQVVLQPFPEREPALKRLIERALQGHLAAARAARLAEATARLAPVMRALGMLDGAGRLHAGPGAAALARPSR